MDEQSAGPCEFDLPLEQLRSYRPERVEPGDFDAFWARTLEQAAAHPLDGHVTPIDTPLALLEVFDVRFAGFGGAPIHGWLLRPRGARGGPCVVNFLGYRDGRGSPLDHLSWPNVGFSTLVVETRGQGGGAFTGDTVDPAPSHPHIPGWVTQGIDSPETYYYRRVFVDAVRAVALARTHPAIAADRVGVVGTSQGGGIALAAAALTEVDGLVADVPFGCHFDRAIRITDATPYGEIAAYLRVYRGALDRVLHTVSYFDGVNLAARATAPAMMSVGLMDRVCPPSTIFAADHHYAGRCTLRVWPFNGHEGGGTDQFLESVAFLRGVLAGPRLAVADHGAALDPSPTAAAPRSSAAPGP